MLHTNLRDLVLVEWEAWPHVINAPSQEMIYTRPEFYGVYVDSSIVDEGVVKNKSP